MQYIYQLLEKFLTLFNKQSKKNIHNSLPENYIGGLNYLLLDDDELDIGCYLPDVENKTSNEIAVIAEKYANFLVLLTNGDINDKIYELLEKTINSNSNPNNILLINNIISFWPMLHKDKQQKKYKKYNQYQPLIRPTQVFHI